MVFLKKLFLKIFHQLMLNKKTSVIICLSTKYIHKRNLMKDILLFYVKDIYLITHNCVSNLQMLDVQIYHLSCIINNKMFKIKNKIQIYIDTNLSSQHWWITSKSFKKLFESYRVNEFIFLIPKFQNLKNWFKFLNNYKILFRNNKNLIYKKMVLII